MAQVAGVQVAGAMAVGMVQVACREIVTATALAVGAPAHGALGRGTQFVSQALRTPPCLLPQSLQSRDFNGIAAVDTLSHSAALVTRAVVHVSSL